VTNRGLDATETARPNYKSKREIHISLLDLCISSREICISFSNLYKWTGDLCISLREIYNSGRELANFFSPPCVLPDALSNPPGNPSNSQPLLERSVKMKRAVHLRFMRSSHGGATFFGVGTPDASDFKQCPPDF